MSGDFRPGVDVGDPAIWFVTVCPSEQLTLPLKLFLWCRYGVDAAEMA